MTKWEEILVNVRTASIGCARLSEQGSHELKCVREVHLRDLKLVIHTHKTHHWPELNSSYLISNRPNTILRVFP